MTTYDCVRYEDDVVAIIIIDKKRHDYVGDSTSEDITSRAIRLIRQG